MPGKYTRRGTRGQWTDLQLSAAKKEVQSGELSVRQAGIKYDIPKSTLANHLKGTSKKRYGGPSTILTPAEEKELVTSCVVLQEMGLPRTTLMQQ